MIKVGIDIGNSKISSIVCEIKNDGSKRFTESDGKKGEIGLLEGAQVVNTALKIIKSQM